MAIGWILRRIRVFTESASQTLNTYVIYCSLPALVLFQIHAMGKNGFNLSKIWLPVSMAWIQFGLAAVFYFVARKLLKLSRSTSGALLLTIGLGNTSFVGFPLLEAIFGKSALATGVLVDQPGSFLVLGTLGVLSASILSDIDSEADKKIHALPILKKIATFPPFLALILGFALSGIELSEWISSALEKIGATLVPIALVSVGTQLRLDPARLRKRARPLFLGLGAKLFVIPVFMYFLYFKIFPYQKTISEIIVIESAMATMITAGILSSETGLDPELSSLMVGIGIPLSLVTVFIWAKVLHVA
jgi:predicted permease